LISDTKSHKYIAAFITVAVVLVLGSIYYSITSDDRVVGLSTDDAIYLLMAEIYSPWRGGTDSLLEFVRSQNHFPPFYPVLMAVMGVDTGNPELASHITTAFLILGFVAAGFWVYRETGSYLAGLLIALLVSLLPGTLILTQELWSEFLFICLLYSTLFLLSKPDITGQLWFIAAILAALCSLTRTIGISLIIAFCLVLLIRRPRYYLFYAAASILPIVYWLLIGSGGVSETAYIGTLLDTLNNLNIEGAFDITVNKSNVIYHSIYWLLTGLDKPNLHHYPAMFFLLAMTAIVVPAFVKRIKQKKIDVYFLTLYLSVVFVWPFTDTYFVSRFLFPVLPLLAFYIYLGLAGLIRHRTYRIFCISIILILTCMIGLPESWNIIQMATTSVGKDLDPYRRNRSWLSSASQEQAVKNAKGTKMLLTSLQEMQKFIPPDDCVYSVYTALVMLHSHRISGALPTPDVTDEEFDRHTADCRYIIALPLVDYARTYPEFYPVTRLANNRNYRITPYLSIMTNYSKPALFLIERIRQTE